MIFLLFLIFLKLPLNVSASVCFNCSVTNLKNDPNINSCLKPIEGETPTLECADFCVENVKFIERQLIEGIPSHYKLTRGCASQQQQNSTIRDEPCSYNNVSKTCVCNSDLCNNQLNIELKCYSCAYSTNNQTITSNGKKTRYISDKTCLRPSELTPMVKCHKRCVEYTRNQTKDDGEVIGIVLRDCLEHLDPRMSFGKHEHNDTCYTDLCNNRHFKLGSHSIDPTNSYAPFFVNKVLFAVLFVLINKF